MEPNVIIPVNDKINQKIELINPRWGQVIMLHIRSLGRVREVFTRQASGVKVYAS